MIPPRSTANHLIVVLRKYQAQDCGSRLSGIHGQLERWLDSDLPSKWARRTKSADEGSTEYARKDEPWPRLEKFYPTRITYKRPQRRGSIQSWSFTTVAELTGRAIGVKWPRILATVSLLAYVDACISVPGRANCERLLTPRSPSLMRSCTSVLEREYIRSRHIPGGKNRWRPVLQAPL